MRTITPDSAVASTVESIGHWVGRKRVKSTVCWYGLTALLIPDRMPLFVYERKR